MKNNRDIYLFLAALIVAMSHLMAVPAYAFVEAQVAEIHANELPSGHPAQQLLFSAKLPGKAALNTTRQLPISGFENTEDQDQKQSLFREADNKRLAVYLFNFSKTRFNSQHVSKLIFPFHTYL